MYPTDSAVNQAIFQALAVSLSLEPSSPEAASRIFRAYSAPPPPESSRGRDLCFYSLVPDPSAPLLSERKPVSGRLSVYTFTPCRLNLVFYGPNASSCAHIALGNIFADGKSNPLSILRRAGMYPVPPEHPPSVFWEEQDSFYRLRADATLTVYLLDNSDDTAAHPVPPDLPVPPVLEPPSVVIHS